MSGKIPREFIDDLLVRVDIVDLIDSHVPLKKVGANYLARCPFHTEKSPSFSVNRNKQFFHCFGCGVSGNAISFLMNYSHLDFVEAVEDLAAFIGVDVPRESVEYSGQQKAADLSSLYKVMEQVAVFYVEQLRTSSEGRQATEYLKHRGVSTSVAYDYMLGYAPKKWQVLIDQFGEQALLDAGLLGKSDIGDTYARFRGRVIFPIRDKRGRTIGFGGRVLDDSLPKYLNSPETPLFHKGREVYGLYELLQKQPKPQRILIVEGYMDVVALAEFGFYSAVATLGTATSQAHIDLLFRFASELVFCFDGDSAGQKAADRAMEQSFSSLRDGRQVRVMLLPQSHDPDSLVREIGVDGFVKSIESSETLSDYFFRSVAKGLNLSEMEGRAQLVNTAKPFLDKLPDGVFKGMMYARLEEMSRVQNINVSGGVKGNLTSNQKVTRAAGRPSSARVAMALLLQNPRLADVVEQKEIDLSRLEFPGVELFKTLFEMIQNKKPANVAVLLELYRGTAEEKTIKALASFDLLVPDEGVEAEFFGAVESLLVQAREAELDRLEAKAKNEGLNPQEKERWLSLLTIKRCSTK
ncbi:MAG: DNA primase [Methylococcaceae bacterium]|jgi:DNA primase|nr:DNA primase [Methylococcaceae bacterium]MDZ4157022.1 DNA primase [Methylococcales bacterium]MDP2394225.1 DNA primase [Methylococcaceae bacterium]MDP3020053.1 DNA primase [Methylococcaceae bacterium]MDP3388795.1 DNA primase [Methylococcaceae bacterium]